MNRWRVLAALLLAAVGLIVAMAVTSDRTADLRGSGQISSLLVKRGSSMVDVADTPKAVALTTFSPTVYDATPPGGYWKVSEAVAEWGKRSGLNPVMTTSAAADVVVYEVPDIYTYCNYDPGIGQILGCTYSDGRIYLRASERDLPYAEHIAGHELGHAFGLSHSTEYRAWMRASVNESNWYRAPQSDDYSRMQSLYGR